MSRAVMVPIALREDASAMPAEICGMAHDDVPGLAVTPYLSLSAGWMWTVTHVGSGRALPIHRHRPADALASMRALAPLTDWTRPFESLNDDADLASAVRDMAYVEATP